MKIMTTHFSKWFRDISLSIGSGFKRPPIILFWIYLYWAASLWADMIRTGTKSRFETCLMALVIQNVFVVNKIEKQQGFIVGFMRDGGRYRKYYLLKSNNLFFWITSTTSLPSSWNQLCVYVCGHISKKKKCCRFISPYLLRLSFVPLTRAEINPPFIYRIHPTV